MFTVHLTVELKLWRQDDNGNRFLVRTDHMYDPTEDDIQKHSEFLVKKFDSGHKQLYWVERTDSRRE